MVTTQTVRECVVPPLQRVVASWQLVLYGPVHIPHLQRKEGVPTPPPVPGPASNRGSYVCGLQQESECIKVIFNVFTTCYIDFVAYYQEILRT